MARDRRLKVRSALLLAVVGFTLAAASGGGGDRASDAASPHAHTAAVRLAQVETFWKEQLPLRFGVELDPVVGAVAYRASDESSLPRCNGGVLDAAFYAENAFYCRREHVIAYDDELLVPQLRREFGDLSFGVLIAHEYGHAIQSQTGVLGTSRELELQADCFAGAWVVSLGATDPEPSAADIERVVEGLRAFSDPAGTPDDDAAHGTASERVLAFSTGLSRGTAGCVDLGTSRPNATRRSSLRTQFFQLQFLQSQSPVSNFASG